MLKSVWIHTIFQTNTRHDEDNHVCITKLYVMSADSSVAVSSPASVYCQRNDLVTSSLSGISVSSESDISHTSHQVAPRFKNRVKNNARKSYSVLQGFCNC